MKMSKNGTVYVKDESFDPQRIDDPYITEAFIPEEYVLQPSGNGLQLLNRNELRHAVGAVAARSLKYFSTNGEGFNIFRTRGMAVWWLRHVYNSFNWWKAFVANAEGERKEMPMLYIGEQFGSLTGQRENEADIVLSAFENDRCIVSPECSGGAVFAVGYSERGGLFNSPDMYGIKTIVGSRYKDAGVCVTLDIEQNLRRMATHTLKKKNREANSQSIHEEFRKIRVVVLDRPRHEKLIKAIEGLGAKVILVKDDDLTPTFAVANNEVDLITGVGGVPEAVLSAIIIEKLGGEMSLRILPAHVARSEMLLEMPESWDLFRKNEADMLKNFKIVRPGTEKGNDIPWNMVLSSKRLASGRDMVFTASVIKANPWIKFSHGKEVPGVSFDRRTGEITVYVVRVAGNAVEIVPVLYKTLVGECLNQLKNYETMNDKAIGEILIRLGKSYAEFGLFHEAKESLQKAMAREDAGEDFAQRCNAVFEYVEGLNTLTNKPIIAPETAVDHFERVCFLDWEDKECLRAGRMIKRFYEYLGDQRYHERRYEDAIAYYQEALKHYPHELKLYRKINSIQMREVLAAYFYRIDNGFQSLNYQETEDWEQQKLKIALEVFYDAQSHTSFWCKEPWLIFFRRTVLHGKRPSYKLAILVKLLRLQRKLNRAGDDELSLFLCKEFGMAEAETEHILSYRRLHQEFRSVGELFFVDGLGQAGLAKLLIPRVKVESQNELEDAAIPLSISLVEAMEHRYKNILEELKEGYKKEAQEHSYAVAEAYHYVGLALYDIGDTDGAKLYYERAITKFSEILEKFTGITPVNAQYRIGNLYEELALLFEDEEVEYYQNAIDAYTRIMDEKKSNVLFGAIRSLIAVRIEQATEKVEHLKRSLYGKHRACDT